MRLTNRRIVRNLICLTVLFVCASAPLAAQRGIDLLDPGQVLRAGEPPVQSDGTVTVRATLAEAPTGIGQATHLRETIRYDDGDFENFEENSPLEPVASGGIVEWAQRFKVEADGVVVSARVCFLRPDDDLSRALDFSLRFYEDDIVNRISYPGRRSGLRYAIETRHQARGGRSLRSPERATSSVSPFDKGTHWIGYRMEHS